MSLETEAKLTVPDGRLAGRIREIRSLAGFTLGRGTARKIRDTYLDTAGRAVLSSGYALRRREQGGRTLITLKSTVSASGAIHRREEWEVDLPADTEPDAWPDGEARRRTLAMIGRERLAVLLALHQDRFVREVRDGERLVAALSLDHVRAESGGARQDYWELEIELAPDGREEELAAMAAWMRARYGLLPATRSKFERALDLEKIHSQFTGS